jgi:wyosine [tRNA(Phe)-imidazoG37] synthetase (radical SAM superfamily)
MVYNIIGSKIELDRNGIEKVRKFMERVYDLSNGRFLNLIDFSLLKCICKYVCEYCQAGYAYELPPEEQYYPAQFIEDCKIFYQEDQERKEALKKLLNDHLNICLNTEMLPNVKINPITPMFVSKYFS